MRRRGVLVASAIVPLVVAGVCVLEAVGLQDFIQETLRRRHADPSNTLSDAAIIAGTLSTFGDQIERTAVFGTLFLAGAIFLNVFCEVINEEVRRGCLRHLHLAGLVGRRPVLGLAGAGAVWAGLVTGLSFVGPLIVSSAIGAGTKGFAGDLVVTALVLGALVPGALFFGLSFGRVPALVATNCLLLVTGGTLLWNNAGASSFVLAAALQGGGLLLLLFAWGRPLREVG